MATVHEPKGTNTGSATRTTEDGTKITYQLEVLQEPERARACGQGAKSSSDRRPVDPPPVVKLRILQGDTDITFAYSANFFLFATLETARPVAHGRVPQPTGGVSAILTGTPVAGISYLDRPDPAGYFIFSDLSVRHEGRYRLSFTLYEELRDHKAVSPGEPGSSTSSAEIGSYVHGRCEVKSTSFDVFSAKRFPGLAESTQLSRLVADQGCRVRIRRDVRMRRRDSKADKDWDNFDDEQTQDGASTSGTAFDVSSQRNVSTSHPRGEPLDRPASAGHTAPPSVFQPPQRHSSIHENAQQYSYSYNHPDVHGNSQPYPHQTLYDQARGPQYPQAPYMPPHMMPQQTPPTPSFAHASYPYPPPHVAPAPCSYNYSTQQPMQSSFYDQSQQPSNQAQDGSDYPVSMTGFQKGSVPPPPQYTSRGSLIPSHWATTAESLYRSNQQQHPQSMTSSAGQTLAMPSPTGVPVLQDKHIGPINPLPPMKFDGAQASIEATSPVDANNNSRSSFMPTLTEPSRSISAAPPPLPFSTQINSGITSKRSFGSVFNTQHMNQPMRAGARPLVEGQTDTSDGSEEDLQDLEQIKISYRRADGSHAMLSPRRF